MDIEKLKSIIRLANNNPNENEANLAARKACKILAENDFSLLKQNRTAADKLNQHATNYGGTWAGVNRSTEPQWRYKPYEGRSAEARAYQEEFFRSYSNFWGQAEKDKAQGETSWDTETNYTTPPYTRPHPYRTDEPKKKESRDRVCSKCGSKVSTYRHKEEPFVCTVCHWGTL